MQHKALLHVLLPYARLLRCSPIARKRHGIGSNRVFRDKAKTIARLLRHEDEHGMGRVFMYAFVNEVIRQKRPFSFDCDSAQIIDGPGLSVVDKEGRSIAIKHKRNRLSLILDDKRPEAENQIRYKGEEYRLVMLAWLTGCIRYTSLQPELRNELTGYAMSIQRKKWWHKFLPVL